LVPLVVLAIHTLPGYARPVDDAQSLGEAARKNRAEKQNSPQQSVRVFTNDDLPRSPDDINISGPAEPAEAPSAAGAPQGKAQIKYFRKRNGELQERLDMDRRELSVLEQKLNISNKQFYNDPNEALRQQYTRQDITELTKAADQKRQQVAQDQQDLENLREELRHAGGDPGWLSEGATAGPEEPSQGESGTPSATSRTMSPSNKTAQTESPSDTGPAVLEPPAAPGARKKHTRDYWQARFRAAHERLQHAREREALADDEVKLLLARQAKELNSEAQKEIREKLAEKNTELDQARAATLDARVALASLESEFAASGAAPEWAVLSD
jgi:hypothetical protein